MFHALKREAQGMPAPSEMDVREWRSRQYDLLTRMKQMSDTRRDKMRDRLFRSRSESVPDGSTFHAWRAIEARARQETALHEIDSAIDLAPPGSQAHLYDLGEDGRPKRVWYASYGSNLHENRFMNYIEGGSPEGSTRTYDGCTDPTPPAANIPIRFAGARPHFALTSRVWRGGIAFIDAQKGESAQGLGRAYDIGIDQFDEVVAQENGMPTKFASPVPLDEALTTGRSVIGNGTYETILHIGDYEGAPVMTFTAPFSTREALTKSGHILRTPTGTTTAVRMPVMTNKPSAAYLRMIGGGLNETFDMDEVQQADYLRGCPGGDRWTRQQMVRILRGEEPDPPRVTGPENPAQQQSGTTGSDQRRIADAAANIRSQTNGSTQPAARLTPPAATFSHTDGSEGSVLADLRQKGLFPAETVTKPATTSSATSSATSSVTGKGKGKTRRRDNNETTTVQPRRTGMKRDLPNVKTYPSVEEQQRGVTRWQATLDKHTKERDSIQKSVTALETGLKNQTESGASAAHIYATNRNLDAAQSRLGEANRIVAQATARLANAQNQKPGRYYDPSRGNLNDWQEEDQRVLTQQREAETKYEQRLRDAQHILTVPNPTADQVTKITRQVDMLRTQLSGYEQRLQETHEIITAIMGKKS